MRDKKLKIKDIFEKADKRHRKCKKILHLRRQEIGSGKKSVFEYIERGYEV